MANYKVDKILEEIANRKIVAGKNASDIARQLNEKPDTIRDIIKKINKSHCNGATAEYLKYSRFEVKQAFNKNDLISIILK